jgi:hypothetical protein
MNKTSNKVTILLVALFLILCQPFIAHAEKDGWPIKVDDDIYSMPALADIDGDGKLEIIVGVSGNRRKDKNGSLYVWNYEGKLCSGWPKKVVGRIYHPGASAGDLDPNYEGLEIAICTERGMLYIWHKDGTLMAGWPKRLPKAIYASPVIIDLDNNGKLEVVIGCADGNVYVYNASGGLVPGWPQDTGAPIYTTPVVKDITQDGKLEILVCNGKNKAYMWDEKGKLIPGWPKQNLGNKAPAAGDLDKKHKGLEIVFSGNDKINILHSDGTFFNGWAVETPGLPSVGDIDKDGSPEVVIISNRNKKPPFIYAWHADGKTVKGWPIVLRATPGYPVSCVPVLRDLDGDERLETIVGDSCYSLHAWYDDGTRLKGFPIGKIGMQTKSPAIADLDNNGHLEIVFGDSSSVLSVHVLELPFFVKKRFK